MNILKYLCAIILAGLITACSEAGDATKVGAAAGGVLGAGLGAVVGSQTGSAGSGLAIGAVAGAGTGALIGNELDQQQQAIRTQDEAIERQERSIATQRAELEELRRLGQDNVTFKGANTRHLDNDANFSLPTRREPAIVLRRPEDVAAATRPELRESDIVESDSIDSNSVESGHNQVIQRGAFGWDQGAINKGSSDVAKASPECAQADEEAKQASSVADPVEKLFHYRRALRLCPGDPSYHNGLGEVYLSLNRKVDAEYEFREALKQDPDYAPARSNLATISR